MSNRIHGILRAGIALLLIYPTLLLAQTSPVRPVQLHSENRVEPLGVDVAQPRLSWTLEAADPAARGLRQTAWQVLVADSPETLARGEGNCWDSGKVMSDAMNQIRYAGTPLRSGRRYGWKVRVWDQDGRASEWSAAQSWTMGVLSEADWRGARWIDFGDRETPASILLRSPDFDVARNVQSAVLHVAGMGTYELTVNGEKSGDALMEPGWTDFHETILYQSHDVTDLIKAGQANTIGLTLGNGYFNVTGGRYTKLRVSFGEKQARALLEVRYDDGRVQHVATGGNWHTHAGPITFTCVFGGEDHDARLELPGWDTAAYAERMAADGWVAAREVDGPSGKLRGLSASAAPIRTFEVFDPIGNTKLDERTVVYDMGQNASMMPRITLKGRPGDSVRIRPSELVRDNGEIRDQMTRGSAWWSYTLGEEGTAEWFPKFFYRGARYLEVQMTPAAEDGPLPELAAIQGVVVHADSPVAGEFECSNELFNEIRTLIRWAQRSNMVSVMTDCPHREKLGWLEQNHLNGPSLRYEFDLTHTSHKMLNDIRDAQPETGMVPNIAPQYTTFGWWGDVQFDESPEWGSAAILVPWQQYLFNGDIGIVEENYDVMSAYMDYLTSYTSDGVLTLPGSLGDWYDLGPKRPGVAQLTPDDLPATTIFYQDAKAMTAMAGLLGRIDDVTKWQNLAAELREGLNAKWFDAEMNSYATHSQTSNAMPLALGMVPEGHEATVLENLIADIREKGLTSGEVGHRYLLMALADNGHSDVVFDIHSQSDKPGYGYILKSGATALPEAWDANTAASHNHFMLGHLIEWLYGDLLGVQPTVEGPGFRRFVVAPTPVGDISWARGSYNSASGPIECAWKIEGDAFSLELSVPVNTTAEIRMPEGFTGTLTEGGRPVADARGVRVLADGDARTLEAGSGHYVFSAQRR